MVLCTSIFSYCEGEGNVTEKKLGARITPRTPQCVYVQTATKIAGVVPQLPRAVWSYSSDCHTRRTSDPKAGQAIPRQEQKETLGHAGGEGDIHQLHACICKREFALCYHTCSSPLNQKQHKLVISFQNQL